MRIAVLYIQYSQYSHSTHLYSPSSAAHWPRALMDGAIPAFSLQQKSDTELKTVARRFNIFCNLSFFFIILFYFTIGCAKEASLAVAAQQLGRVHCKVFNSPLLHKPTITTANVIWGKLLNNRDVCCADFLVHNNRAGNSLKQKSEHIYLESAGTITINS